MNLTIYELKNLQKNCNDLSSTISLTLKSHYEDTSDTPFDSSAQYDFAKKDVYEHPEKYFKVQIFDRMTYITFDRSSKLYHIVVRNFYSDILNVYKRYQRSTDCYIISSSLAETKEVFQEIVLKCIDILKPQQEFIF